MIINENQSIYIQSHLIRVMNSQLTRYRFYMISILPLFIDIPIQIAIHQISTFTTTINITIYVNFIIHTFLLNLIYFIYIPYIFPPIIRVIVIPDDPVNIIPSSKLHHLPIFFYLNTMVMSWINTTLNYHILISSTMTYQYYVPFVVHPLYTDLFIPLLFLLFLLHNDYYYYYSFYYIDIELYPNLLLILPQSHLFLFLFFLSKFLRINLQYIQSVICCLLFILSIN